MFTIFIDTREQMPYTFNAQQQNAKYAGFRVEFATLRTGDYSLTLAGQKNAGPEHQIVISRKSLPDLYSTLGSSERRKRWLAEWERMKWYGYAAVVIEAGMDRILTPFPYLKHPTRLHPASVLATLTAWSQRCRVAVWPCTTREIAEAVTFDLLRRWWTDHFERRDANRGD